MKTIQHFAPDFLPALARVKDPRNPDRILYSVQQELLVTILGFMVHVGSRRNFKYMLNTPAFIQNLQEVGRTFYPGTFFPDSVPHGCTLNYLLKAVPPAEVHALRTLLIRALLRGRCLERFRLVDRCYMIAIDGTGCLTFKKKHCEHCLKKTKDGKVLYYYHSVLEAKLVLGNGMVFSIATEFIENERADVSKEDCELNAFYRLEKQIKQDFPQLRICLLLDGLYAGEPVFRICEENRWDYLITFKGGSMPAVFREYETLRSCTPENQLIVEHKRGRLPAAQSLGPSQKACALRARLADSQANPQASGDPETAPWENERSCFAQQNRSQPKGAKRPSDHPVDRVPRRQVRYGSERPRRQIFRWINDVITDKRTVNVLECTDKTTQEDKYFAWLSSIRVNMTNVEELGNGGGRLRWKIENEGFNIQKNGGYELEHAFSMNNTAMKNFYVLMQIGHIYNQLMEKGSLLRERIRATMGSLKVFSRMMWAELTQIVIDPNRLRALLGRRIQIRFETSYLFDTS